RPPDARRAAGARRAASLDCQRAGKGAADWIRSRRTGRPACAVGQRSLHRLFPGVSRTRPHSHGVYASRQDSPAADPVVRRSHAVPCHHRSRARRARRVGDAAGTLMLRGAIVGFGHVARFGHWPAYASTPDARIVAVVDRTASGRELAAGLSPAPATFATLADL